MTNKLSKDFYKVYRYVMWAKQNENKYSVNHHNDLLFHNEMSENETAILDRVTPYYFKTQLENKWHKEHRDDVYQYIEY